MSKKHKRPAKQFVRYHIKYDNLYAGMKHPPSPSELPMPSLKWRSPIILTQLPENSIQTNENTINNK